jgi:hypothetical protein
VWAPDQPTPPFLPIETDVLREQTQADRKDEYHKGSETKEDLEWAEDHGSSLSLPSLCFRFDEPDGKLFQSSARPMAEIIKKIGAMQMRNSP